MDDKPIYYDTERKQMYWIEWLETGNNDIPTRHYIGGDIQDEQSRAIGQMCEKCKIQKRKGRNDYINLENHFGTF
jgi:hypothetical protein